MAKPNKDDAFARLLVDCLIRLWLHYSIAWFLKDFIISLSSPLRYSWHKLAI